MYYPYSFTRARTGAPAHRFTGSLRTESSIGDTLSIYTLIRARGGYAGVGGGLHRGACKEPYRSNIPPWPVFIEELDKRGMTRIADLLRSHGLHH
jgi:hypothetical protein